MSKARSEGGLGVASWSTSVKMVIQICIAGIRNLLMCPFHFDSSVGDVFKTSYRMCGGSSRFRWNF